MTKIKKRNYLGLGIAFAIVALAISMMCFSFSIANENEVEQKAEQQANPALTVAFELSGQFDKGCTFEAEVPTGCGAKWDNNQLTLPEDAQNSSLTDSIKDRSKLQITYQLDAVIYTVIVTANSKNPSYSFVQYQFNSGSFTEPQKVVGVFQKTEPSDYSSVTISGNVSNKENNDVISGADVSLGNEKSGEVYATTHSGADGSYQMSGLDASLFKDESKLDELVVMASYPNKAIYAGWPGKPQEVIEGIGYVSENISLEDADITILGADFHKNFVISLDIYGPDGKIEDECSKWTVENVGFPTDQLPLGATFTIDENGVFCGRADQDIPGVYAEITCKPVGQDGYTFEYYEMSGTKYHRGESFEIAQGATGLTGVVHYSSTGGQIAQTGDAIPFVAIAGLGMVAAVAYVVARKRFN